MRKKYLKRLFLVPLLAGIFYGCYSDVFRNDLPPEIIAAKEWYEMKIGGSYLHWRVGDRSDNLTADWQNAIVGVDAEFRIVEVPLKGSQLFFQGSSEIIERAIETGDERYLATIKRLLVRTCRETGEKDGFVMMASPDLEYLSRNLDNPMRNFTYLNHGDEFSGLVFFYNLAGGFVTGYRATGGSFFRLFSQAATDDQPQLRGMDCVVTCVTTTFYWDFWSQVGNTVHHEGTIVLGSHTECSFSFCLMDSGEPGIGGGGGGDFNPPPPSEPADPCAQGAAGRTTNNTMLNNPTIQDRMHNVMLSKLGLPNEWAVSIGRSGNTYFVSAPREGTPTNVSSPPNPGGSFVATAHSHPGIGTPSPPDVFAFLELVRMHPTMQTMFIYGRMWGTTEIFAINLHDREAALQFLDHHPRNQTIMADGHFMGAVRGEFDRAIALFNNLYSIVNHGGHYFHQNALALAHIMNYFNMGITLSRRVGSGSFQTVNVQVNEVSGNHVISGTQMLDVSLCP